MQTPDLHKLNSDSFPNSELFPLMLSDAQPAQHTGWGASGKWRLKMGSSILATGPDESQANKGIVSGLLSQQRGDGMVTAALGCQQWGSCSRSGGRWDTFITPTIFFPWTG